MTTSAQFPAETSKDGAFVRQGDAFRDWVRAGNNNEVWVDFAFAAAVAAVADFGTIKIVPGATSEMPVLGGKKRTLVAPIGGVTFGARS